MLVVSWITGQLPRSMKARRGEPRAYFTPLLEWGPHHLDLEVQGLLRTVYLRNACSECEHSNLLRRARDEQQEVLICCEPSLSGCLAVLVELERIRLAEIPLNRVHLVLLPRPSYRSPVSEAELRGAFGNPVSDVGILQAALELRREIPRPDCAFTFPDFEGFGRCRDFFACSRGLLDFLPDECGTDLLDRLILGAAGNEDRRGAELLCLVGRALPEPHDFADLLVLERLLELATVSGIPSLGDFRETAPLLEISIGPSFNLLLATIRLTPFGRKVRDRKADALSKRRIHRWVGGRLIEGSTAMRAPLR